jgi:hypothetical protein
MSAEEAEEKILIFPADDSKVLHGQDEVDEYIRDNMNEKMPLDGPMLRLYVQKYTTQDEPRAKMLMIWKQHHAFCDGVSVVCLTLACS